MRTNVEIDDALMKEAMQLTRIKTQKQVIESALKEFIAANHRQQLMSLRGKVEWEGNLEDMRALKSHFRSLPPYPLLPSNYMKVRPNCIGISAKKELPFLKPMTV